MGIIDTACAASAASATSATSATTARAQPAFTAAVKHMAGMLWYDMLSELNQDGLAPGALGTGGDDFQDMFLWSVAQNDFGKYDTGLSAAAMRQDSADAGGAMPASALALSDSTGAGPGLAIRTAMALAAAPALPTPGDDDAQRGVGPIPAAARAAPDSAPSGTLIAQAQTFARAVWPEVSAAAQALGVPAVAVLAQSALETGWGSAMPGHNVFGIKALDGQPGNARPTHEMIDGVLTAQTAVFRAYPSTQASVDDYVGQIRSGFQGAVGQTTVGGFAQALQRAGYATDPLYAAKIVNLAHAPLMAKILAGLPAPPGDPAVTTTTTNARGADRQPKTGAP